MIWNLDFEKNEKEWKNVIQKYIWDTIFKSSTDVSICFKSKDQIQSIIKLPMKTTVFLVSVTFPACPPIWFDTGQMQIDQNVNLR